MVLQTGLGILALPWPSSCIPGALQRVDGILVGLGPVDNADRVGRFSILRIGLEDFELPVAAGPNFFRS